jgi:hypothetical protein
MSEKYMLLTSNPRRSPLAPLQKATVYTQVQWS